MQDTPAFVAQILAQMAEPAVRLVNQDQRIRICHNVGLIGTICGYSLRPYGGLDTRASSPTVWA